MGFVLSIVYFLTNYLTPDFLWGSFANYHIELILAILIFVASLPELRKSYIFKVPQSLALVGLAVAIFLSVLVGMRWFSGAVTAFVQFIPYGGSFFFVCLHCNTRKRLKTLVLMLLFVCLLVIARGSWDLWTGVAQNNPTPAAGYGAHVDPSLTGSPFFMNQRTSEQDWIYRLQGLGEIHDPNDFGQLLICVIPLTFIFWREKKFAKNLAFVILPLCVLLFGAYLTHSRGALVALTVVAIAAARRRIGTIPALVLGGGLVAAAMALHFTGGRDISASAGEDRTALWGISLQLLKVHPLFGIGYENLNDQIGLTAHNSIAVCAAELGIFGLYFWSLYLFSTLRDALAAGSPLNVQEGEAPIAEETLLPQAPRDVEEIDKEEINRFGRLMFLSLVGFLVAGWFLSRAFIITLFLLGGMTEVIYELALRRGMIAPRLRTWKLLQYAGLLTGTLIAMLYIVVRFLNFMQ